MSKKGKIYLNERTADGRQDTFIIMKTALLNTSLSTAKLTLRQSKKGLNSENQTM